MHQDSDRVSVRRPPPPRVLAVVVALLAFGTGSYSLVGSSGADVVGVKGSAFGYFTNVSLFGGPSSTHGPAPTVTLPPDGSATPVTARLPDGAKGQYGPAVVFGGIWPDEAPTGGPSGPITVSTQGTKGPNGSVTSSVDIVLHNPPRPLAPGGIGPGPLIAKEAHSTCTATESGVTGSSRFVDGVVETKYDTESQLPIQSEIRPIPADPPPNQEYTGTIDHVGDHFRIVINEQIRHDDGSLTVNAAHMFLLGPIAVGEMIVGQSVCGVVGGPSSSPPPAAADPTPVVPDAPAPAAAAPGAPSPASPTPTSAPPGSPGAVSPSSTSPSPSPTAAPGLNFNWGAESTTSSVVGDARPPDRSGTDLAARPLADRGGGGGLPLILLLVAVAGGTAAVIWTRRRRSAGSGQRANGWQ